jgi:ABC-type glycerol-3-phosphate transport system substrate-binding protein
MKFSHIRLARPKAAIALTAVGALVAVLSACSSSSPSTPSGPQTLALWEAGGPLYIKALQPVIQVFKKAHPTATIKPEAVPEGNYQEDVLTAAAGNTLPCILYVNSQNAAAIFQGNVMSSIPSSIITPTQLADYPKAFLKGLQNSAGTQLAVPDLGGVDGLYIRTNTKAGDAQPLTYAQWIAFGKAASVYSSSGKLLVPGIGWNFSWDTPGNYSWLALMFQGMVQAAGGQFLDANNGPGATKALFDSPAGLAVMQFMHDTIWKYHIALPPSVELGSATDPLGGWFESKENSAIGGSFMGNAMATFAAGGPYAAVTKTWDAVNQMPEPNTGGKSVVLVDNDGYGVPNSCPDKTLAWEFIKTLTSAAGYSSFAKVYEMTVTGQDVSGSPAATKLFTGLFPAAIHYNQLWTDPALEAASVPDVGTVANQAIFQAVDNGIVSAMNDPNANLSATLSTMATQVTSALQTEG